MSNLSKQYYPIEEDEMQALIARSKKGDQTATNELLALFQPYLNKYVSLLYYGKYDLKFYDIRRFIRLFVPDPKVGYYLMKNQINAAGRDQINEVVKGLRYMVERYGDYEDVKQTVEMTFLATVDRYEPTLNKEGKLIPFSGFIYSYFFYLLSKHVKSFLIDQLGRKTFPLIDDSDVNEESEPIAPGYKVPVEKSAEDMFAHIEIDEFWVAGDSALWPFNRLEVHERQLLKWRYVDRMKYNDIAAKITEHPNTCREHLSKIREKVKKEVMYEKSQS